MQKERCSLSGESATVSLGTISDNASTKAMAGSILNTYMPLDRSGSFPFYPDDDIKSLCFASFSVVLHSWWSSIVHDTNMKQIAV